MGASSPASSSSPLPAAAAILAAARALSCAFGGKGWRAGGKGGKGPAACVACACTPGAWAAAGRPAALSSIHWRKAEGGVIVEESSDGAELSMSTTLREAILRSPRPRLSQLHTSLGGVEESEEPRWEEGVDPVFFLFHFGEASDN